MQLHFKLKIPCNCNISHILLSSCRRCKHSFVVECCNRRIKSSPLSTHIFNKIMDISSNSDPYMTKPSFSDEEESSLLRDVGKIVGVGEDSTVDSTFNTSDCENRLLSSSMEVIENEGDQLHPTSSPIYPPIFRNPSIASRIHSSSIYPPLLHRFPSPNPTSPTIPNNIIVADILSIPIPSTSNYNNLISSAATATSFSASMIDFTPSYFPTAVVPATTPSTSASIPAITTTALPAVQPSVAAITTTALPAVQPSVTSAAMPRPIVRVYDKEGKIVQFKGPRPLTQKQMEEKRKREEKNPTSARGTRCDEYLIDANRRSNSRASNLDGFRKKMRDLKTTTGDDTVFVHYKDFGTPKQTEDKWATDLRLLQLTQSTQSLPLSQPPPPVPVLSTFSPSRTRTTTKKWLCQHCGIGYGTKPDRAWNGDPGYETEWIGCDYPLGMEPTCKVWEHKKCNGIIQLTSAADWF